MCRNLPAPAAARLPEFTRRYTPRPTPAPKRSEGHQFSPQTPVQYPISNQPGRSGPLETEPESSLIETLCRTCQTDPAAIKDSSQIPVETQTSSGGQSHPRTPLTPSRTCKMGPAAIKDTCQSPVESQTSSGGQSHRRTPLRPTALSATPSHRSRPPASEPPPTPTRITDRQHRSPTTP